MDSDLFNWVILPILIFCARIVDVSLGTLRIILIAKGKRNLSPLIGFVEILIWLTAIRQIFNNLNNPVCFFAYAGGFATGNYVGMWIEHKLALGMQVVRIITRRDALQLIETLKDEGYGITVVDAEGTTGSVKIIFTVIKRKDVPQILKLVRHFNPKAFYSIEDIRTASEGIFPTNGNRYSKQFWRFIKFEKKGK